MRETNVARVVYWIAGTVALVVAITLPLGYWSVAYNALATEAQAEARFRSELISNFINDEPTTWKDREHRLDELLNRNPPRRPQQRNRLFDIRGSEVASAGDEPQWPLLTTRQEIHDIRGPAARLEMSYSLRTLARNTAWAALFGVLLAAAVFIALRVLPLRALARATSLLEAEITQHDEARRVAEAANRAKSQFLAAASHDLRQPLHALGLFAASLSDKVGDGELRGLTENISASVEALETLFNELLDVSKLDAGVIQPNLTAFPLHGVLDRLRVDYEPEARSKGVRLRIVPTSARVYSDPVLLERILRNLIANAIRYTASGAVMVCCRHRRDSYTIEVRDSGIGIPADKLDRVFDEFYQIGNFERDRRKGLGLGLAIVRRIEHLLGYHVQVRSAVGRGTTFSFDVPRAHAETLERTAAPRAAPVDTLRDKCVVVVDDEHAVLEGMTSLLTGWGCQVIAADSLREALGRIKRLAAMPHAIIADYRLREGETGIEVIRSLQRTLGTHIPAMLITGDTATERLREVQESGIPQLHKPVAPAALRASLAAMFAKA